MEVWFHHSLCLLILKFLPPPGRLYPPKNVTVNKVDSTDVKADTRPVRITRTKAKVVSSAGGMQKVLPERKKLELRSCVGLKNKCCMAAIN